MFMRRPRTLMMISFFRNTQKSVTFTNFCSTQEPVIHTIVTTDASFPARSRIGISRDFSSRNFSNTSALWLK